MPRPATLAPAPPEPRRVYRFTKEQFYRLLENNEFGDERIELINGEVVPIAAQRNWHAWGIDMMKALLMLALGPNYWVRSQSTLDLSPYSVPDPDIAVIPGRADVFLRNQTRPRPS